MDRRGFVSAVAGLVTLPFVNKQSDDTVTCTIVRNGEPLPQTSITFTLDARELARAVAPELPRIIRRHGIG